MKLLSLIESLNDAPTDDASRIARAQEMGFDTSIVYYHGTPDNREIYKQGFKPSTHNKGGFLYFTPSYRVAHSYADDNRAWDYQNSVPEVLNVFLRFKNPETVYWGGHNFRYQDGEGDWHNVGDKIAEAKANGHDAIIIRGISDEYGGNGNNDHGHPDTIVVVFDPTQVRSIDATFDPTKNNSAKIMD